jgi:hypothetical protein
MHLSTFEKQLLNECCIHTGLRITSPIYSTTNFPWLIFLTDSTPHPWIMLLSTRNSFILAYKVMPKKGWLFKHRECLCIQKKIVTFICIEFVKWGHLVPANMLRTFNREARALDLLCFVKLHSLRVVFFTCITTFLPLTLSFSALVVICDQLRLFHPSNEVGALPFDLYETSTFFL